MMPNIKKQHEKDLGKTLPNCNNKPIVCQETKLAGLVEEYLKIYKDYYNIQAKWWGDRRLDWRNALERAWISKDECGKIHSHQRRVGFDKLSYGLKLSIADDRQPHFQRFEQLYEWIESISNRVQGLGEMTTYDVAQRLGMWLELYPTVVYLQRGGSKGAAKLNIRGKTAPLDAFPQEIQLLGTSHAENFLCIYKDYLG
ncbi:MAG: hypothetical protein AB4080_19895 [Trichodesmium sp.]